MYNLVFILASFLLVAGWTFVYKPSWIIRFNKLAREKIFNDDLVLLGRKKWGTVCFVISLILLWLSYYGGQYTHSKFTERLISNDRLLYQSLQHLYSKQYQKSKILAERVLMSEPENAEALYQLAATQFLLNDSKSGEALWARAQKLDPNSAQALRLYDLILQLKTTSSANLK